MFVAPNVSGPMLGRWLLPVAGAILLALVGHGPVPGSVHRRLCGVAMFRLGLAMSFYDMSANMRIAALETRHGMHLQNLNHAMFSFAFAASAFVTTLARTAGLDAAGGAALAGAALLVLAARDGARGAAGRRRRSMHETSGARGCPGAWC